jgi:hypothetical protein
MMMILFGKRFRIISRVSFLDLLHRWSKNTTSSLKDTMEKLTSQEMELLPTPSGFL